MRDIRINGPVDISVVAIMTNVSRRLIYLEKEISFSHDLLFFFRHNLTFYPATTVILFFFSLFLFRSLRTNYCTSIVYSANSFVFRDKP